MSPPDSWRDAMRRAAESVDALVERALRDVAIQAWGRGLLRRSWRVTKDLDQAAWRAYRYVDSTAEHEHRYLEIGVVCHVDPAGRVVGFGVDNCVEFLGLKDVSEYGLRRGLDYVRRQPARLQTYSTPRYDHSIRTVSAEGQ